MDRICPDLRARMSKNPDHWHDVVIQTESNVDVFLEIFLEIGQDLDQLKSNPRLGHLHSIKTICCDAPNSIIEKYAMDPRIYAVFHNSIAFVCMKSKMLGFPKVPVFFLVT